MMFVGTSGWQYRDWRNAFYPPDVPQSAWLTQYATRFATVEVNNTFYRLPDATTFHRWRAATPEGFTFAVKASRYITHLKRLRDPADPVDLLLERAGTLKDRLGPFLFQLPPTMHADAGRLSDTLQAIGGRARAAFEFRHPSWLTDPVLELLNEAGAALVLVDRAGRRSEPLVTGGWSYVRFHQGTRMRPGYRRDRLRSWADVIMSLPAGDVFVYFNNDPGGAAPRDAGRMMALLAERGAALDSR